MTLVDALADLITNAAAFRAALDGFLAAYHREPISVEEAFLNMETDDAFAA